MLIQQKNQLNYLNFQVFFNKFLLKILQKINSIFDFGNINYLILGINEKLIFVLFGKFSILKEIFDKK